MLESPAGGFGADGVAGDQECPAGVEARLSAREHEMAHGDVARASNSRRSGGDGRVPIVVREARRDRGNRICWDTRVRLETLEVLGSREDALAACGIWIKKRK